MHNGFAPHLRQRSKAEQAQNFWGTTWRLLRYLKPWHWLLFLSIIFAIAAVIFSVSAPKILGQATTTIYAGVKRGRAMGASVSQWPIDFHKVGHYAVQVLILYGCSAIFSLLQQLLTTQLAQRVVYTLRRDLKRKMRRLPVSFYDTHDHGDIMSRMVNDMDNVAATLQQGLIQIVTSAFTFIGVLVLMLTISLRLTLVALITIPIGMVIVGVISPKAQRLFGKQQATLGTINNQVEETYTGQQVVKLFGDEKREQERFEKGNKQYFNAAWKAQFFSILVFPAMNFVRNLGFLMVAVVGSFLVAQGQLAIGAVQAILQYQEQFSRPITQLANLANVFQQTIASSERIFAILDEPEMKSDTVKKAQPAQTSGPVITFKDVKFSYRPDQPLIDHFNLDVAPRQTIAIVGPTGAGKSTLINLLERFYDVNAGKILLHGVNTQDMTRADLRRHFAIVPQETWLFHGTIMDNISFGHPGASAEDVYQAAGLARADHFIRTLPDGYQTVLGEGSTEISTGQQQLLTIARAFAANPEILILDEATSSVDTRTESLIQAAMDNLRANRTTFIVAHRLSTVQNADQIIVLNHGHIVETGNHESLLAKGGFYARLYNSQFRHALR
ncbi:ABC transporter ATP-binding protein [Limosilactobacillus secaliphilus]|uniref:Lipid A export permease ATP-binding protein MsbA n=1 Tax=Limosilactobacillus secaliphilus TaxID=396268 RepID=A0A0R2I7D0_9LACO|nr:ABC transporter ATP-binding protein [Limosilactobacillus secaliphilus]KRN58188.1 lipid A export permease ATP-binding protein MsbA [Limosilactobacillus secaliphilus]